MHITVNKQTKLIFFFKSLICNNTYCLVIELHEDGDRETYCSHNMVPHHHMRNRRIKLHRLRSQSRKQFLTEQHILRSLQLLLPMLLNSLPRDGAWAVQR